MRWGCDGDALELSAHLIEQRGHALVDGSAQQRRLRREQVLLSHARLLGRQLACGVATAIPLRNPQNDLHADRHARGWSRRRTAHRVAVA